MNLSDAAKSILRAVAPTAASYFGTPLAGMAVKSVLDRWMGPQGSREPEAIEEVLLAMTPAQALELKRADQDFAKDMAEIGLKADALQVDLERVAAEDRASARQREALLKDWAPKVLAVLVITGYAAATGFILTHVIVPEMESLVMRTLGVLDVALGMVLSYYFGSSAGSKEKTTTMARLASGRRRVS